MRTPVRGYAARRSFFRLSPGIVATLVLVIALGVLWGTGLVDLSTLGLRRQAPSTRGLVPVPTSAGVIPAYTKVVRDHLWNTRTNSVAVVYLRPEQVTPDIIRSTTKIIGRVLDHTKPAGYVFTESDFLPEGTRPGLVAGIPAGKRAMRVEAERIHGLVGLQPRDRFDLVSTLTIDTGRGLPVAALVPTASNSTCRRE